MFGRIDPSLSIFIVLLSFAAAAVDVARSKIPNLLTLPALILGLVLSIALSGWAGAQDSLLGVGVTFLSYIWIYALGWLGAGDVKLLMALGALGGWRYGLDVAVLSIGLGGLIALVILLVKRKLPGFVRRIYRFVLSRSIRGLEPESLQVDESEKFPFGVAIGIAAVWNLTGYPLQALGWRLW